MKKIILTLAVTINSAAIFSQAQLVKDINTTTTVQNSTPSKFVNVNGTTFFIATNVDYGIELWKTDGTSSGSEMVKDISPGIGASSPNNLTNVNGTLFFSANSPGIGTELWKSDGTDAGTVIVKDIVSGSGSSNPSSFAVFGSTLYFSATDGINGTELWKSDGTDAGTVMVKDIYLGISNSSPSYLTAMGSFIYFSANDGTNGIELWKSDGTSAGTVLVRDICSGASSSNPAKLTLVGTTTPVLFFTAFEPTGGTELWESDGTGVGTVRVLDINPGAVNSVPDNLTAVGTTLFFSANDGTNGIELWKSEPPYAYDITATVMVMDINASIGGSSSPQYLTNLNGKLFFSANNVLTGTELWSSMGSSTNTVQVKDINPNTIGSSPNYLTAQGNELYFYANEPTAGSELWKSDGTSSGTSLVADIEPGPGSSNPNYIFSNGTFLLFSATTSTNGIELWKSDGIVGGSTNLLLNINPEIGASNPSYLTNINDTVYFFANDGINGNELWKSDGSTLGTTMIKDINPGYGNSIYTSTENVININGTLYFVANDGLNGNELWKSNGTNAGTVMVKDINPTPAGNSNPIRFVNVNGKLFFFANNGTTGNELWTSDGTDAGTVLVKDIYPGTASSLTNSSITGIMVSYNNLLYFQANDGSNGYELWKSDGTAAGTILVKDIYPGGGGSSSPGGLTVSNGKLFFSATDANGTELWISDGTTAGTTLLKDIMIGPSSSSLTSLYTMNGTLFFSANDGAGSELWKSDGTSGGTVIVKNIWPGNSGSIGVLTKINNTLFFRTKDSPSDMELWKTDGTSAGTMLVKDYWPGTLGSSPGNLTSFHDTLFYTARSPVNGTELCVSTGTAQTTGLAEDIYPGIASSAPSYLTATTKALFFSASNGIGGRELWKLTMPPALQSTSAITNLVCNDGTNGAINLTVTGGTPPYSFTWSNSMTTEDVTGLSAGTYSVDIIDSWGWMLTKNFTIAASGALSVTASANTAICPGQSATISGSTTGGDIPINYSWSPSTTCSSCSSTTVFPSATTTYTLTTTDYNNCSVRVSVVVTVNPNAAIALTSEGMDVQTKCINTDITSITYSISGGGTGAGITGLPPGVTGSFTGVPGSLTEGVFTISGTPTVPGTFNYTVTTTGTCVQTTATGSIVVNPNAAIALTSATGTDAQTKCINTAITSITYSVTGGGTGATITGLPTGVTSSFAGGVFTISGTPTVSGTFNYTVTTTGTCNQVTANGSIIVNPNTAIALTSATGTDAQTKCINTAITAITYSITGGGTGAGVTGLPTGVTGSFAGGIYTISGTPTVPGTFNYTVTTTGTCTQTSATGSIVVNPNAAIALTSAAGSDAQTNCINTAITSITYSITGGGTGATITGLPTGVTGSFAGGVFTISGTPTVSGTFNYTVTTTGTCNQVTANGSIIVNPNTAIALTSTAGTDAQTKCINTAITSITYSITGGGTGATITGLPTGITGSFAGGIFTISGTPTVPGTFNYTVTTTGTCVQTTATGSIVVNPNAAIALTSAAGSDAQTNCINTAITSITYSITGGGTGATITGLPTGVTSSFAGGVFTISGTPTVSGTFNYTVTTTGTCNQVTANGSINVNPNTAIALTSATGTDAQTKCINTAITAITYSITGGGTGATITGLPTGVTGSFAGGIYTISGTPTVPGTFNYTVTTTGTCVQTTATGSIVVNPNAAIALTSAAGSDAQTNCINTAITSITYSITGGGTGATITGLPTGVTGSFAGGIYTIIGMPTVSGTFNYTVTTTGTCNQVTANGSIIVNPNTAIALTSAAGTDAQTKCINTAITAITYSITGGGSGATITGLPTGVTGSFAGGIYTISGTPTVPGTFNYTVTTTGTCNQVTANGSIIVNPNTAIALTSAAGTNAQTKCINTAITAITYSITGGGTGATITGLPTGVTGSFAGGVFTINGTPTVSGTFNYTVTTTGTCTQTSATGSIIVNSIPPAPTASSNSPVNVGNTLSLTASTISGATYSWLGPNSFSSSLQNPTVPSITIANAGIYSVTATVNGCTSPTGTTSVTVITISISTTQTNVSCNLGNDGAAAVLSVSGGTAPYTYSWNTIPAQTSQDIYNLTAGTYTVTVTDSSGYSATTSVSIIQPPAVTIFTNSTNVFCYGGNNGTAHAIAGGGTSPFTYSWNTFPSQTGATSTNLSSGNYTVTVTDFNGCVSTKNVAITQPPALFVSMTIVNSNCGTTDGSATANVTGGTSPYSYQWSNGATTAHISNLASQTYTVTVTDAKGCSVNSTATIGIIAANFNLAFTASPQNGAAPLPATFTNGTPNMGNYNFSWYWGDGNNVSDNNSTVFYTYNFAGTYDVALIATSIANGCKDTLARHPYINVTGTGCGYTSTITPAGTINKCQGDTLILTANTNATTPFTYQWNIGSVTISGANSSTLAVTQGGYYSVTIIKNNCPVTSSAVQVNFTTNPQQPTITSNGTIVPCIGGSVTLTSSTISGVTYSWNTTPVQNTSSIIVSSSGNYMVTATNTAGCTSSSPPYTVNASLAQVPICMVSVDTFSTYNIIYWEKPVVTSIDSFKVYREVTTNTYTYLGSVDYNSLSEYHDYNANPNVTSYKYKLTLKDTCGNESPLSDYHNTIHLQYLGLGNLQWTLYDIENAGNPVDFYRIYRDDTNTGNFLPISSTIPGGNSTFTDVNYASYPNSAYRVDVAWSIGCTPTRQLISTTRSNIKHQNVIVTGIVTADESTMDFSIYPNPANDHISIELFSLTQNAELKIIDMLGQIVYTERVSASTTKTVKQINTNNFSKGIYFVIVETGSRRAIKKMVIN